MCALAGAAARLLLLLLFKPDARRQQYRISVNE